MMHFPERFGGPNKKGPFRRSLFLSYYTYFSSIITYFLVFLMYSRDRRSWQTLELVLILISIVSRRCFNVVILTLMVTSSCCHLCSLFGSDCKFKKSLLMVISKWFLNAHVLDRYCEPFFFHPLIIDIFRKYSWSNDKRIPHRKL